MNKKNVIFFKKNLKNIYFFILVFHYSLFPKSIGQLIKKFKIEELHLQFTQGRWLTELWGFPIISSPVGVELLTWFNVSNENNITLKKEVDNLFQRLTNTLSGVFCASMAQMKNTVTVQPSLSFDHVILNYKKILKFFLVRNL